VFDINISMKRFYVPILTIFFIFSLFSLSALADDPQSLYGLAMHGQAKYSDQSDHLDYVNPNAPKGGNIKIAAIGSFDTLNPFSLKGQAPQNMNLVYDRLMRRVWDEPFTMYPLIAERVEIPNDRSWIKFHINPKARFHDDSEITAQDVLFSYETLKEHGRPNMRRIYKLAKDVTVSGKHSITFTLGEGYDRETVMIFALMPVLSKDWWQNRDFDATTTEPPLGNGPYRIKNSDTSRSITYERVDDYWAKDLLANKGHYNFQSITYDYFRDDTIALESFKKGDLDIRREWDVGKWRSAYGDINSNQIKNAFPHNRPERAHGYFFNTRKAPFDNIKIRKALTLAFDADWVHKNLYHGEFKRIDSFFPNSILAASTEPTQNELDALEEWTQDIPKEVFKFKGYGLLSDRLKDNGATEFKNARAQLRQADALLKEAGWVVVNGVRVHEETQEPFKFELLISTPQDEKIALSYKRNLERLGINLEIRMADSATFQKRKQSYDYDVISFFQQFTLSPGTEQTLYWTCKAADEIARFNFSGVCNPALDHFAYKIGNAKTYDELKLYAHIIDRIAMAEYIFIPLFYKGTDYIALNRSINFPQNTPIYGAVMESWWMAQNP